MGMQNEEIVRVLREVLVPLVRADGGELYIAEEQDETLTLHLAGRFSGCPGNTLVRRRLIEPALHAVAPQIRVTITSGPIIPPGARRVNKDD